MEKTYTVGDTPNRDPDALRNVQASLDDGNVVAGGCLGNIELSDGDLLDVGSGESAQGSLSCASLSTSQVSLTADTLDQARVGRVDSVDERNEAVQFGVDRVEVVIIDIPPVKN